MNTAMPAAPHSCTCSQARSPEFRQLNQSSAWIDATTTTLRSGGRGVSAGSPRQNLTRQWLSGTGPGRADSRFPRSGLPRVRIRSRRSRPVSRALLERARSSRRCRPPRQQPTTGTPQALRRIAWQVALASEMSHRWQKWRRARRGAARTPGLDVCQPTPAHTC